jgi:hypothetical protein
MKSLTTLNIKTMYNLELLLKCRVHMVFKGPFLQQKVSLYAKRFHWTLSEFIGHSERDLMGKQ